MVFHGPPGTGKTYVARSQSTSRAAPTVWSFVQFHPRTPTRTSSRAIGQRPRDFELRRGPLRRLADRAAADPAGTYVLIIDELNCGNSPRCRELTPARVPNVVHQLST
ncbi:MAG: AAA family ATPase [Acidimicrobiales bacterium]